MINRKIANSLAGIALTILLLGNPKSGSADDAQKPVGFARAPWATSHVKGTPEPPLPYVTERAFPSLKFQQSLDLTAAPGSDRLFVVEQSGKIFSFPNQDDVATADLVIDFAKEIPGVKEVYSLVFHPDFVHNRYCFVC